MKSREISVKSSRVFLPFLIIITLITVVQLFFFPIISVALNIPLKLANVKSCEDPVSYYLDEQVIYDNSMLEGSFERVQDKQPGKRQFCWHYREEKTVSTVLDKPVPSIIKVGTKRVKDQALLAMTSSAGIRQSLEDEPVSIRYVDNYSDFIWAAGMYDGLTKAITVKKDGSNQPLTLAHEYLHYVWYRDGLWQDKQLVNELNGFYAGSTDLRQKMVRYTGEMTKPTEFFSFGCTEWNDNRLTDYVISKCNKYLDRSKLPIYRHN